MKQLINTPQSPGAHHVVWNGLNTEGNRVACGVYFCSLDTGKERSVEKLIIAE